MHLFLQSEMGILDFFRRQKDNDNEMKYLIAGLGNMGAEYDGTRDRKSTRLNSSHQI